MNSADDPDSNVVQVIHRGRIRPRVLPKPKPRHGRLSDSPHSSPVTTTGDVTGSGCKRSSSAFSSNSAGRQQFETRTTRLQLEKNDEKQPPAEDQKMCRRLSEPVDKAGAELVADVCFDQQRRGGLSNHEQRTDSTPSEKTSQNSFIAREKHCRKLSPGGEKLDMWSVSLDAEQIQRVELFYASHATQISVCRCLASLYFTSPPTGRPM